MLKCEDLITDNRSVLYKCVSKMAWMFVLAVVYLGQSQIAFAANCLYVSSYHAGNKWNDGIERGLDKVLAGKCAVDKFYMDTKRNKDKDFALKMALEAKKHIEATKPDVVIACDDNASKYLIKPYYKDAGLPFVFCGINWTTKEYGFPYSNVTGMVEISPIRPLQKVVREVVKPAKDGVFISADVLSQRKDYERYKKDYAKNGIVIRGVFVKTLQEWKQAYKDAQQADFVVIGNYAGLADWDESSVVQYVKQHAKVFSVTNHQWMMPYSMFAMTKIPEEQGEWAAQLALSILDGEKPANLPVVSNRRWNLYVNPDLLAKAGITLPANLINKSVKVGG